MREDLELIRAIARNRDVACPLCRYNLRDITTDRCPECRMILVPSLGMHDLRLGWLIASIVPGAFSGLCALFLGAPMIYAFVAGQGPIPAYIVMLDLFGLGSGVLALCLIVRRRRFLALSIAAQRGLTIAIWSIHMAAFLLMAARMLPL